MSPDALLHAQSRGPRVICSFLLMTLAPGSCSLELEVLHQTLHIGHPGRPCPQLSKSQAGWEHSCLSTQPPLTPVISPSDTIPSGPGNAGLLADHSPDTHDYPVTLTFVTHLLDPRESGCLGAFSWLSLLL